MLRAMRVMYVDASLLRSRADALASCVSLLSTWHAPSTHRAVPDVRVTASGLQERLAQHGGGVDGVRHAAAGLPRANAADALPLPLGILRVQVGGDLRSPSRSGGIAVACP